jgi:hypothetical protein
MGFNIDALVHWMKEIQPATVYIGYDNYGNGLPEPSLAKTLELAERLSKFTRVRRKTLREPVGDEDIIY